MRKKNRNTIIQIIKSVQWPKPARALLSAVIYMTATVVTATICSSYGNILTTLFI